VEAVAPWWRPGLPRLQPRAWLVTLAPTRRSVTVGLGIVALALGGYLIARETPLFAIDRIEVEGGSPQVVRQVRSALASVTGTPLVGLDGSSVLRKVEALPTVVRASYDRAFPHTLRITVVPERPAAVLRSGPVSWLVSTHGRVIERLTAGYIPSLPRVWVSSRTPVRLGTEVATAGSATAARAVGLAGSFASRVASASDLDGVLVFHLRSGLELVLGDGGDVRLKLAVAERALTMLPPGSTFLDVSIPGRPVSGVGSPTALGTQKLK
jgi:cell division protein FtsQ